MENGGWRMEDGELVCFVAEFGVGMWYNRGGCNMGERMMRHGTSGW